LIDAYQGVLRIAERVALRDASVGKRGDRICTPGAVMSGLIRPSEVGPVALKGAMFSGSSPAEGL